MTARDPGLALLTDLYELTMASAYFAGDLDTPATFDLVVRDLPANRNFLVAAGLQDALTYLETLRFSPDDLAYLRTLALFDDPFLEHLESLRFRGDVWAIPEGEVFFAGEPFLRLTAPRIQAQIVETYLLNCLDFETMIATKAARIVLAAQGRAVVDFSARRDHGVDASLKAARASYIAGAASTSNVLAGRNYGIPVAGTMAHAFVMSFDREIDAFRAFVDRFPNGTTLLIDTYNVRAGALNAITVAREAVEAGHSIGAVRLDSGNIAEDSRMVRALLDDARFDAVRIFVSGDLDEYRVRDLLAAGAPVDAFGVGTRLGTSSDAPSLGGVYKLAEDPGGGRLKLSAGKVTYPGRKQVYRREHQGTILGDTVALDDETGIPGRPLLQEVMRGGKRTAEQEPLSTMRDRCAAALATLPAPLKTLGTATAPYPVDQSPGLRALYDATVARLGE